MSTRHEHQAMVEEAETHQKHCVMMEGFLIFPPARTTNKPQRSVIRKYA